MKMKKGQSSKRPFEGMHAWVTNSFNKEATTSLTLFVGTSSVQGKTGPEASDFLLIQKRKPERRVLPSISACIGIFMNMRNKYHDQKNHCVKKLGEVEREQMSTNVETAST